MFTDLTNTRNSNLYLVIALAITLVVILTFALAPSIAALKSALIPVTGSQNVYVEFLRGKRRCRESSRVEQRTLCVPSWGKEPCC